MATEWASATTIPADIQALIGNYFNLLDTNDTQVGNQLADEILTHDGVIHGPTGTVRGSDEIRVCRSEAWKIVQERKHVVKRAYVFNAEADDLLVIGEVTQILRNGKQFQSEWVARLQFRREQGGADGKPRITYHKVWADFGGGQATVKRLLESN